MNDFHKGDFKVKTSLTETRVGEAKEPVGHNYVLSVERVFDSPAPHKRRIRSQAARMQLERHVGSADAQLTPLLYRRSPRAAEGPADGNDAYHQHKQAAEMKSYFSCAAISSKSRKKDEKERQVFSSRVKSKQLHIDFAALFLLYIWGHSGHTICS